eukprot:scaffold27041_cov155-Skeletonema_menzelii.AAC.4
MVLELGESCLRSSICLMLLEFRQRLCCLMDWYFEVIEGVGGAQRSRAIAVAAAAATAAVAVAVAAAWLHHDCL